MHLGQGTRVKHACTCLFHRCGFFKMRGRPPTLSGYCLPQPITRIYRTCRESATENGDHFSDKTPIETISHSPPSYPRHPILQAQRRYGRPVGPVGTLWPAISCRRKIAIFPTTGPEIYLWHFPEGIGPFPAPFSTFFCGKKTGRIGGGCYAPGMAIGYDVVLARNVRAARGRGGGWVRSWLRRGCGRLVSASGGSRPLGVPSTVSAG